MSDQTSIFNSQDGSSVTPNTPNNGQGSNLPGSQNADLVTTLLGSIKNEKGEQKYKSLEDALVALQHSQTYIPQLTAKLTEREQELANAKKEADKIAELERSLQALTQMNSGGSDTQSQPNLSEESIAAIVSKTLTRTQQESLQQQNLQTVITSMKTVYGDKAEEVFYGKAKDLGMTVQEFNALAAKTPKAVLDLIGVKSAPAGSGLPQSSVNSGGFTPNQQSFIGRNKVPTLIGATSQDLMSEAKAARDMVAELHAQGKSVHDLTDPKVYMKMFN